MNKFTVLLAFQPKSLNKVKKKIEEVLLIIFTGISEIYCFNSINVLRIANE